MKKIKIGEAGLRELTKLEVGHDTVGGNTERPTNKVNEISPPTTSDIAANVKRRQERREKYVTKTFEEVGRAYVALINSCLAPKNEAIKTKGETMKTQKQKKFKPSITLGGDEVAKVAHDNRLVLGGPLAIFLGYNRITPAQALRLADWLKQAAKEVGKKK